jgi:hypothetical protein
MIDVNTIYPQTINSGKIKIRYEGTKKYLKEHPELRE